jgi:hypothetical protein
MSWIRNTGKVSCNRGTGEGVMDGGECAALQQRVGHLRGQEPRTGAHLQQKANS